MRLAALTLAAAVALAAGAPASAHELVVAREGGLPILLTVPHGGAEPIPGVAVRRHGVTSTDAHTIELAQALERRLEKALGARPYVVMARFARKHADANRAEGEAYESPDARAAYDAYHERIAAFVAALRARFPAGALLVDVHGQSEDPSVVHRGTRNGATVAALVRRHGEEAVAGPRSVTGALAQRGFTVFPPGPTLAGREDSRYRGGHTVYTYGSNRADGIDAIQLEVGRALRTDPAFAEALGDALVQFHDAYLRPR